MSDGTANGATSPATTFKAEIPAEVLKVADACLTLLRAEFILDREYYSFLSRIDRDFPNFEIKPGPAGRMEDA